MRMTVKACLLLAAALTPLSLPAQDEWSTFHGDSGLTGSTRTQLPATLSRAWRVKVPAGVTRTPVGGGGMIVCVTQDSELIGLTVGGALTWSNMVETGKGPDGKPSYAEFMAPPILVGGLAVIGSTDGDLFAFNAATGAQKWKYSLGTRIIGSANWGRDGTNGLRITAISQPDGAVHCVNAAGDRVWVSDPAARCDGCAAVDSGRIVFGSCASAFHVFGLSDGTAGDSVPIGADCQVAGGVALSGDRVYAGDRCGTLVCADLREGKVAWTNGDANGELFTTPALSSNRVVFSAADGRIVCVTRDTGTKVWAFDTGGGRPTAPVVAGDKVLAAASGKLYLLDLKTGTNLWSAAVSDDISSPAVIGRLVVVGGDDGTITAFGPGAGR